MRYFGVYSAIGLYIALFILTIFFQISLFVNGGSVLINTIAFFVVCASFYLFAMPYYKIKPGLIMVVYCCLTIAVFNFSCSSLADIAERERNPDMLLKDDWSGVIIAPIIFIIGIVWGWIFDWRKNKVIKS